tara:strand:- start:358 stop:828 length:471 start_codon:yes stop_codon:yes gene_type:complete
MKISNQTARKLIEPIINKDIKNWRIILDAMKHWLSDVQMEMLLEIIHNDGFTTHQIGDIVKFKPESWHFKDQIMHDIMKDWQLMDSRGYMYGKVVGDCGYDDGYNPFHYKLMLKVYLHGDDINKKDIRIVDHSVDNTELFATKLPIAWRDTIKNLE